MPSETDTPFEPFFWPDVKADDLTTTRVLAASDLPTDTAVETVTLRAFFGNATKSEEWHNAEEAAEVERFKTLVKTIKTQLADPKVFRIGDTKIDCYIVGEVAGGCGGLKTQIVET